MTNPEVLPLREQMLSEDYWHGPVININTPEPGVGTRSHLQNILKVYQDNSLPQAIGNVVLSLNGGCKFRPIPEGSEIPQPSDNPRQVVKLVLDSISIFSRLRPTTRIQRLKQNNAFVYETILGYEFDEMAEILARPEILKHKNPISVEKQKNKTIVIEREIAYMRAAGYGSFGALLSATFIDPEGYSIDSRSQTKPMPHMEVGGLFRASKRTLTKVHSAGLFEAEGVLWTHGSNGNGKPRERERAKLWRPGLRTITSH